MTDLEITKLCAEAIWPKYYTEQHPDGVLWIYPNGEGSFAGWFPFNPLRDDAQAMALVKKFSLDIIASFQENRPTAWSCRGTISGWERTHDYDLNRAICECVAKMQQAKK